MRSRPSCLIVAMVACPLSREVASTEYARRSRKVHFSMPTKAGEVFGSGVGARDRRHDRRAMNPENFPEVGIGSVLIEYGQRHRAVRGEGVDGLIAERRIGEVVERHIGGVGPGGAESLLALPAVLHQ